MGVIRSLKEIASTSCTTVLYESSHRIEDTIKELCAVLGQERRVCICRELTKMHESIMQLSLQEAVASIESGVKKGEFTLVLEGKKEFNERMGIKEEDEGRREELSACVRALQKEGLSRDAIQRVMNECFGVGEESRVHSVVDTE